MAGGFAVRAAVLSVALVACGTSSSSDSSGDGGGGSPSGGISGTGGSGAGQAGTAGSGATTNGGSSGGGAGGAMAGASGASAGMSAISQSEACLIYTTAYCRRYDECRGLTTTGPYDCGMNCPDIMFAPGSTRTVESQLECAAIYPTWPCEDLLAWRAPPCASAGTRQLGEPCFFSAQCQSQSCKRSGVGCGMCARAITENGDCTAADAACVGDLSCLSGVCRRTSSPIIMQPGQPCANFTECDQSNAFCNADGICESYGGENESCADTNKCTSQFYCASADHICRPRPGAGEPCVDDAASGPACGSGLRCTVAGFPVSGTCVTPTTVEVGDDCTSPATLCPTGATCTCLDPMMCTEKRCTRPRLIGESCSTADPCDPALDCTNGTCVPPAYQNLYETACGQ